MADNTSIGLYDVPAGGRNKAKSHPTSGSLMEIEEDTWVTLESVNETVVPHHDIALKE